MVVSKNKNFVTKKAEASTAALFVKNEFRRVHSLGAFSNSGFTFAFSS